MLEILFLISSYQKSVLNRSKIGWLSLLMFRRVGLRLKDWVIPSLLQIIRRKKVRLKTVGLRSY